MFMRVESGRSERGFLTIPRSLLTTPRVGSYSPMSQDLLIPCDMKGRLWSLGSPPEDDARFIDCRLLNRKQLAGLAPPVHSRSATISNRRSGAVSKRPARGREQSR